MHQGALKLMVTRSKMRVSRFYMSDDNDVCKKYSIGFQATEYVRYPIISVKYCRYFLYGLYTMLDIVNSDTINHWHIPIPILVFQIFVLTSY